jgi:hypothetical protein
MNKALKIVISIATIGVIGTAGYFVYKAIKKGRDGGGDGNGEGEGNGDANGAEQEPSLIDPPSVGQGGGGESLPKTPFTNKAQGDMFRWYINEFYKDYAKSIGLDLSGAYDNSYMRKAWMKYGKDYTNVHTDNYLKTKGNGIPANLLRAMSKRKSQGVFLTKPSGEIYLLTNYFEGIKIKNSNVDAEFYSNGKVAFDINETNVIATGKWWDDGKQINVNKKNYKGTDFYNTAYKVIVDLKKGSSSFNGNLQGDLDVPSRRGLDLDMNIID